MKKILSLTVLSFLAAAPARAEFSFLCGETRDKGVEKTQVALVDSLESSMKLYLDGKEVDGEKLGFKAADGGRWIVSVDRGEGKGSRKFVFSQKDSTVQESSVSDKGSEKKTGSALKCKFKQVKAE